MTDNPAKSVWAGLAFEQVCKDHLAQIKKKLGISGVVTEVSSWKKIGDESGPGAQIDLVIKRRDKVIDLCEIKLQKECFKNSLDEDNRRFVPDEVFETVEDAKETIEFLMAQYGGTEGPLVYPILLKSDCTNIASKHVLLKCGFETVFEGIGDYQGEKREVYQSVWKLS